MNLHGNRGETIVSCVESPGTTRVKVVPGGDGQLMDITGDGQPTGKVGVSVVVPVVVPLRVNVVSITEQAGGVLMQAHRAPMSPLVLLDGVYFSSGRLPRRKLEKRLAKTCGPLPPAVVLRRWGADAGPGLGPVPPGRAHVP